MEFVSYFDDAEDAPPIALTIWDYDEMGDHDFLGSAIITINQSDLNPQEFPHPKWIELNYGNFHLLLFCKNF